MTAAVASDRFIRCGADRLEPRAGDAMGAAPAPEKGDPGGCRLS
jgi:hypothetical protein